MRCGWCLPENLESMTLPRWMCLPRWAKMCMNYMVAMNRDTFFGPKPPYHILHRRFRSVAPLMFKRRKAETEFSVLSHRKMPAQVALGAFLGAFVFTMNFVILRNSLLGWTGVVLGEFLFSVFLLLAMVVICFSYCFSRVFELAIAIIIGLVR